MYCARVGVRWKIDFFSMGGLLFGWPWCVFFGFFGWLLCRGWLVGWCMVTRLCPVGRGAVMAELLLLLLLRSCSCSCSKDQLIFTGQNSKRSAHQLDDWTELQRSWWAPTIVMSSKGSWRPFLRAPSGHNLQTHWGKGNTFRRREASVNHPSTISQSKQNTKHRNRKKVVMPGQDSEHNNVERLPIV